MIHALQRLLAYFLRYKYRAFVVSMVGLVVVAVVLRALTPEPAPVPPKPALAPGAFTSVSFTGVTPIFPAVLATYKASTKPQSPEEYAQALANQLNLPASPALPNLWIDQEKRVSLTLQKHRGEIVWLSNQPESEPTPLSGSFDLDQAVTNAKTFLQTLVDLSELEPDKNGVTYLFDETPVKTPAEAHFVIIPFVATIEDRPVYYDTNSESVAKVFIKIQDDYPVLKAVFSLIPQDFDTADTLPTRSLDSALAAIQSGQATIVSDFLAQADSIAPNDQKRLELTSVSLEYRYQPTTAEFEPYYRFIGTTYYLGAANTDMVLIVPATQEG